MLNIIQNTIGAIRRVGEGVVRAGLKMWLPFTKAEPLGENLVVNGGFSDGDTSWYESSGWSINSGKANRSGVSANSYIQQSISLVEGRYYKISYERTYVSGFGETNLYSFFTSSSTRSTLGSYTSTTPETVTITDYFTAGHSSDISLRVYGIQDFTGSIDNVVIEEYAQATPDISGNDNNAILKTGKCLTFTGNDSVQTAFPSSKTIKTIAFWIYPTHTSSAEGIFWGGGGAIATRELRLVSSDSELESINSNITMNTYVNGVYRGVTYGGTPAQLELNQWQRVVLTSSTGFSTFNDTFDIGGTLYAADGRFKMSDLQIYGAEFTSDDIAYDYANPQKLVTDNASSNVTLNDLHAWWHMSEGDGTIAFDSAPLIGKELVVNGDFSTDSDWAGISFTISGGKATVNIVAGAFSYIYQFIPFVNGKTYKLNAKVRGLSGSSGKDIRFQDVSDDSGGLTITNGLVTLDESLQNVDIVWTANSNSNSLAIARHTNVGDYSFELISVSVKEVFNIDGDTYDGSSLGATYDDAQERIPQLGMMNWSKGSNLIEYSEDFSDSYWDEVGVTFDSGYLAPDGTMSAHKLSADVSGSGAVNRLFSGIGSYYRSIWAKTTHGTGSLSLLTRYDSTGSVVTITNEWQRFTINSADSLPDYFYAVDFRGGNLDEVILWGAQLEDADSVSAYRKTNGTAVTGATLISCATDSQKDILGNAVRAKGSGFNLDGTGYGVNETLPTITNNISLSFWVKLDTFIDNNLDHIIGRRTGTSWLRVYRSEANSLRFEVAAGVNVPLL